MPYSRIEELPPGIKDNLPKDAQRVWMRVFNETISSCQKKQGTNCEKTARIAAWVAVENGWKKNKEGKWIRKG